jgi:hypothetical protein
MHVIQRPVRQRVQRRMYLASERQVVNGVGLGEVDGLFNVGKMFKRMTTFTPRSFQLKNIMGALGSATMFTASGGLSSLAPKITGAHSSVSKAVGYGTAAVAAVAGGVALLPAGSLTGIGSSLMTGLKTVASVFPVASQVLGGGGSQQQQQQVDPYAQQYVDAQANAQAQAAYEAQVRAQQLQMYTPGGYTPNMPYVPEQYTPPMIGQPGTMQTSYGDLRSPYTAISEDGQQTLQIDSRTGQVIQAGIIPDLSMTTWLMIGGATVVGWYLMSGSKSESNN